jgi:hypothetical protein
LPKEKSLRIIGIVPTRRQTKRSEYPVDAVDPKGGVISLNLCNSENIGYLFSHPAIKLNLESKRRGRVFADSCRNFYQ